MLKINEEITVGPQPSESELAKLKDEGFKTVANFRTEGEEDQPISPQEEGEIVRGLELNYLHVPVSMKEMKPEQVDQFREEYEKLPKPIYGHCQTGKRAGAFAMMHLACEQNLSGDETIRQAQSMGFECDKQELVEFVRDYVDGHSAVSR
jgi:uncharacterized protein (TIGR01244 family)